MNEARAVILPGDVNRATNEPVIDKADHLFSAICRWAAIALVSMLVIFVTARCFTSLGDYDGPYNGIMAKNFVLGQGYKTTYPAEQAYTRRSEVDQDRYFNVEITTGPGLLFWSVPFIAAFGSQYWTLAIATASLSFLLLAGTMYVIWRNWPATSRSWWVFTLATFALAIFFTAGGHGNPPGLLRPWYELVGELPCSLSGM